MSVSIAFFVIRIEKKYKILILFYLILVYLNGHSKANVKVHVEDEINYRFLIKYTSCLFKVKLVKT